MPFVRPQCTRGDIYEPRQIMFLGIFSVEMMEATYAACLITLFTSFLSVFGGFFASGMKRAYKFKDFSDILPGHGGFLDRSDCNSWVIIFTAIMLRHILYPDYEVTTNIFTEFSNLASLPGAQEQTLSYLTQVFEAQTTVV